mmetsp:Transcript_96028/g.268227  ORF Transcript_96028/g.268227 Transcript_96028/m.268227 type:complete len:186 (+) Transcript_96028:3-560(+)
MSNVGMLAGAMAGQLRSGDAAAVSAIGPAACYATVKAAMIAERYLAEHLEGRSLGILPSRREFAGRDGGRDTNGMELLVRTLELPAELPAEPQVLAAANTNVGLMAGLMANILKGGDMVTVGAMGPDAVSKALKATILTQKYMADSLDSGGLALALVPRLNSFEQSGEERTRVLLGCVRVEGLAR